MMALKRLAVLFFLVTTPAWADPNQFQNIIENACNGIKDISQSVGCKKVGASFLAKYPIPCAPAQVAVYKLGLTQNICTSISSGFPNWATSRLQCYQSSGLTSDLENVEIEKACNANWVEKGWGLTPENRPDQLSACYDNAFQKKKDDAQLHLDSILAAAPVDAQLHSTSSELTCKNENDIAVTSDKAKFLEDKTGGAKKGNNGQVTAGAAGGEGN